MPFLERAFRVSRSLGARYALELCSAPDTVGRAKDGIGVVPIACEEGFDLLGAAPAGTAACRTDRCPWP